MKISFITLKKESNPNSTWNRLYSNVGGDTASVLIETKKFR